MFLILGIFFNLNFFSNTSTAKWGYFSQQQTMGLVSFLNESFYFNKLDSAIHP